MKTIIHLLLASSFLLLTHASLAQTHLAPPRRGKVQPHRLSATTKMDKDGVTMKDSKLLLTEQGHTLPLDQDKKLLNGTLISTTGTVTHPDGTTEKIAEGDLVSLTGRLTTHRSMVEQDSVRKLVFFDLKHPGKRKEMDKARAKAEKAKAKADAEKAKMAAKANR
ncbi:MAG: DUF6799 domain-containing protein [Janthinobacterium lividum]